jgi:hypothetical protein
MARQSALHVDGDTIVVHYRAVDASERECRFRQTLLRHTRLERDDSHRRGATIAWTNRDRNRPGAAQRRAGRFCYNPAAHGTEAGVSSSNFLDSESIVARRDIAVAVVMVAITLAIARGACAQAQPPPVIRFNPGGIGLEEAVVLTLQNAAIVKLQDADLQRSTGAAKNAGGQFDASRCTRAGDSNRIQELTENRKQIERRKRETIREELERNRTNRARGALARVAQSW